MFDPFGFALENFDATGAWRTTDGGAPVDASGTFSDGTRFNGPAELRAGLVKSRHVYYANVTQLLMAYALNRKGKAGRVYDYEMPALRKIVRDGIRTVEAGGRPRGVPLEPGEPIRTHCQDTVVKIPAAATPEDDRALLRHTGRRVVTGEYR